jgi:alkylation response protein AidB-like acyl-CoA dehydrogenase
VAPNSGNQSILVKYGTAEQKERWLLPLIDGSMESGFSMTEPENAGSDPRSLTTTAVAEGDEWVINGHKWFTSNGSDADFFIVMCRAVAAGAEPTKHDPMVQIIVPTKVSGVNIVRGIGIWGGKTSDHCEVLYENVRVPKDNTLGQVGEGHQAAQDRLGAGRIYHCMNSVGQMWRAFDLMVERARTRQVHGGLLEEKQFIQGFIADSYIDIQAARLMTLHRGREDRPGPAGCQDRHLGDQGVRAGCLRACGRPGDPGVGRGRRLERLAAGGDVSRRSHLADRRRAGRSAPDSHREERAGPIRKRRRLGLRQLSRVLDGHGSGKCLAQVVRAHNRSV